MPRTPADVLGALALREWSLAALASPGRLPASPPATAEAWRLFLRGEQCALVLDGRGTAHLGGVAAAAVRQHAVRESRMVLAARHALRRLGATAGERGLRLVLLKGAVALDRGGGFPGLDIDLLGSPDDAASLARALDDAGYHGTGAAAAHRLAVRVSPDGIPIEIHTAVPGLPAGMWGRVRPAGSPGLLAPHPADHLTYLLLHSVVQHADRRGRLRDLLLIAEALAHAAPEDVAAARDAIAREPQAAVLGAQLEMAREIGGADGGGADRFEVIAAGRYLMDLRLRGSRLPVALRELAWQAGAAAVARRSGTPSDLGGHTLNLPSAFAPLAALRRLSPPAERALRVLVRRGREWAMFPLGSAIGAAAARAVREKAGAA